MVEQSTKRETEEHIEAQKIKRMNMKNGDRRTHQRRDGDIIEKYKR